MSTGDLLFIFAFIVLPTIILVSCIWTLLLIRAGVLLPARRAATYDAATQNGHACQIRPIDLHGTGDVRFREVGRRREGDNRYFVVMELLTQPCGIRQPFGMGIASWGSDRRRGKRRSWYSYEANE